MMPSPRVRFPDKLSAIGAPELEFVAVEHNAAQPDLSFLLGRGIQSWTPMGEYLPFEEWYAEYQYGGFVEPGLPDEKEEAREGYHQHRGGQVH